MHAIAIAAAMGGFLRARGHWDQAAEQYQTALIAAREAGDLPGQAGVLDELGLLQQLSIHGAERLGAAGGRFSRRGAIYLAALPGQLELVTISGCRPVNAAAAVGSLRS